MIISYKCPNCGDDMVFDSSSGMLTCHSCGRQDQIESLPKEYITTRFSENEANEYRCENCGAVLMTEAETTHDVRVLRRSRRSRRPIIGKSRAFDGDPFYDQ